MKYNKNHYKKIQRNGYIWGGFIDGLHYFIKKTNKGYLCSKMNEKDLINGNFEFMIDNQLTR